MDSTLESTYESSCYLTSDADREITMEDFLELEDLLELEDGETLEYLDSDSESCVVELEPIEERMHKSKSSHLAIPEHLRPPICAEKADVKRTHELVKFVVPCVVVEVEFPIPPDRSVHLGSYNG
ncbi:hypothetical protein HID58_079715, partial [Brassica napus]